MSITQPEYGESALWLGQTFPQPPIASGQLPLIHNQPLTSSRSYQMRSSKGSQMSSGLNALARSAPPPLDLLNPTGYSTRKRSFSQIDDSNFAEAASDHQVETPDTPKPKINNDHQLLFFGRLPETHTILDQQKCIKHIELTAQLHGMFFLSELATTPGEFFNSKPELTCYRRNLFQISGSVKAPGGSLSCLTPQGDSIPIVSMHVQIAATESVDGHIVKLIVIPWKTPPPNSPEISSGQEREPSIIPLTAYNRRVDGNNDFIISPIAYRRLQFRIATANNGRRRELQQHFTLHLSVVGTLADGSQVKLCESSTAPIVVRGRSPRNFQARKEIPLVGSSSSRGNPPELQIAMSLMASNALAQKKSECAMSSSRCEKHESPQTQMSFLNQLSMSSAAVNDPSSPDSSQSDCIQQSYAPYHPISPALTIDKNHFMDDNLRLAKSPRLTRPQETSPMASFQEITSHYSQTFPSSNYSTPTDVGEYFSTGPSPWESDVSSEMTPMCTSTSSVGSMPEMFEYPSVLYGVHGERPSLEHYTWNDSLKFEIPT
ncbi:transcriptional regulator PacG/VIB-1 [Blumeria hordei DH14]|uniref:Transcriptional regulator PacG/VIB-1 n=1 Tax=Blumeria graminis f. sp. hordei (strain DH14) TaxID=546991 RepID=N1JI89_BLUG1|nr:transcriptional regulator PacG/VIB-1 [Blumeria hordei DH14]